MVHRTLNGSYCIERMLIYLVYVICDVLAGYTDDVISFIEIAGQIATRMAAID